MRAIQIIKSAIQYITEGFMEIFSPDNDSYPAIGIQPYGGTIISHHSNFVW